MDKYQYNLSIGAAFWAVGCGLGFVQGNWGGAAMFLFLGFVFLGMAWQKRPKSNESRQ